MATTTTYEVTRLPGAPARRAGREWPEGETVTLALSDAEAAAIAADPGYRVGTDDVPTLVCPTWAWTCYLRGGNREE